ncbi:AraC family transcriptional regulator, partial [Brachyspira innocens]
NILEKTIGIYEGCKDSIDIRLQNFLLMNANKDYPILSIDRDNIVYSSIVLSDKKIIVGPNCINSISNDSKNMLEIPLDIFCEEILFIHNLYNNTEISYDEMLINNFINEELLHKINKEITDTYINTYSNNVFHNPYDRELRILESIRNGDLNSLKQSLDEKFIGQYGVMAKDKIRSYKNVAICHICLSSRAAIDGGISSEVSFSICDNFVRKLEDTNKIEHIQSIEREAQFYFAQMVYNEKNNEHIDNKNYLINQCKEIIIKNINKKIVVKDIAKKLYTNSEYLSRVFSKQEGITIKDYIQREKITFSKNMLIYYEYSFGEIAQYFSFYSQSHYIKIFKKWTGTTPKKFRDEYGIKNK